MLSLTAYSRKLESLQRSYEESNLKEGKMHKLTSKDRRKFRDYCNFMVNEEEGHRRYVILIIKGQKFMPAFFLGNCAVDHDNKI